MYKALYRQICTTDLQTFILHQTNIVCTFVCTDNEEEEEYEEDSAPL